MKIFGFNISRAKTQDQIVVQPVKINTSPVSRISSVKSPALQFGQMQARGRGHFTGAEYDLSEIGKIEDCDSFVRQAFKKKIGLMFKEGFEFGGANKHTVRYVKIRFAQIARASNIPTIELAKRIGSSLVRVSNAFVIKVRDEKASGGKKRTLLNGRTLKPVAGYFPAAPETMRADMDQQTGRIIRWRQMLPDGQYKEFPPEDVVHFYIDRREGFLFGIPTIVPAIDDIRALRQLEENVELLLYQNLFPLFHYIVGTETAPAGYAESGESEIEVVQEQIRLMPSEGVIVTPERHRIEAVGAEGRALRAEGYLDYFKKRVLAGLGVSQVDMGDGDTTNRATANTLSRQLVDSVKDIQDAIEAQIDHEMISELLLESTFGERVLDEENMVHLKFAEIDIQNKMDQEEHHLKMFEGSALTYDEFRKEIGREPILLPITADDQDPNKYPEWFQTYWKLIGEPTNLIRAVDEPFSAFSQAVAEARSLSVTAAQVRTAQTAKEKEQAAAASQKTPNNTPRPQRDNFVKVSFLELKQDTKDRVRAGILTKGSIDSSMLMSMSRVWATDAASKLQSLANSELIRGFNQVTGYQSYDASHLIAQARDSINLRISFRIDKLIENTISSISRQVDSMPGDVKLSESLEVILLQIENTFNAIKFRTDFIWDVEIRKAFNYGKVLGARFLGGTGFRLKAAQGACDSCSSLDNRVFHIDTVTIDDVPPLHPNSRMELELIYDQKTNEDQLTDASKLERCVLKVKKQLREENPRMSEEKIKSRAFAICNSSIDKE